MGDVKRTILYTSSHELTLYNNCKLHKAHNLTFKELSGVLDKVYVEAPVSHVPARACARSQPLLPAAEAAENTVEPIASSPSLALALLVTPTTTSTRATRYTTFLSNPRAMTCHAT